MGFFSELKNDLSPEAESKGSNGPVEAPKPVDLDSMLNRLDDIKLDEAAERKEDAVEETAAAEDVAETLDEVAEDAVETIDELKEEIEEVSETVDEVRELEEKIEEQTMEEIAVSEPKNALEAINPAHIDKYVADVTSKR